ncbi:MAG TPA: hypothetical protein VH969_19590 [Actinophytocola sp.]|jgi:uncharacterized membrane protein|uniref:hypothetical protein n=1 Tax=Actinophytocola sp. TaxID=1872138 RepID=UPI002F956C8E
MRSAPRLVIVALLGLLSALPAAPAVASAEPATPAVLSDLSSDVSADVSADDQVVAQQPTTTKPAPSSPGATAPSGPKLQPETENDQQESKRKLVMGVASVVLVGIVIWGRSIRSKRRKKQQGAGSGG